MCASATCTSPRSASPIPMESLTTTWYAIGPTVAPYRCSIDFPVTFAKDNPSLLLPLRLSFCCFGKGGAGFIPARHSHAQDVLVPLLSSFLLPWLPFPFGSFPFPVHPCLGFGPKPKTRRPALLLLCSFPVPTVAAGHNEQEGGVRDVHGQAGGLPRPLWVHQAGAPGVPHGILQGHPPHPSVHLQGDRPFLPPNSFFWRAHSLLLTTCSVDV